MTAASVESGAGGKARNGAGQLGPVLSAMARDPTVLFTACVVLVPLIYVDGWRGAVQYLTTPMLLVSLAFLALVLVVTHGGPCVRLNARDTMLANWFLMNGVYFNLFLDVVSGQFQMMDEMSRQYTKVEPRYVYDILSDAGAPVFFTSMLELFFQSPFGILAYFAYHRGLPFRHLAAFFVSVLHAAGVWYFYIPEALGGFRHLGGWPRSLAEALSFERLVFFW
jgi:hypothetical protein